MEARFQRVREAVRTHVRGAHDVQGFDPEVVQWVIKAVDRNEYKRRQAAPGLKVTGKAFGMGRRMPIAAKIQYK